MSEWPYPYCPHQAFNKNLQIRLASVPYSFVPDPTIDAFTNVNIKCCNLNKHNIPSLAYEQYFCTNNDSSETNFAKDYYLASKDVDAVKFDNRIVEEKKEEMDAGNAYALASEATTQYQQFETRRKNALENARRRAQSTLRTHYIQKKDDLIQANQENGEWLKKLYRKLEEIAKHIVEGDGESQQEKEKMFLLSKGSLTANYLSQIKVRNPQKAFEILEELRVLMMKKKLRFQNQRDEQQRNKSVSMSMTSEVSQNTSQGSFLSEATSLNASNIDGEEELIAKFSDFNNLSKKWGVSDINQVKYLLRLMLTRKYVSEAEANAVKKKKEAQRMNKSLQKLNPELAKKIKEQKQNQKANQKPKTSSSVTKKRSATIKKNKNKSPSPEHQRPKKGQLSKQEQLVKDKLIVGGQFDAVGQKFERNRNFSHLFAKKQEQIKIDYTLKGSSQKGSSKATPLSKSNRDTMAGTLYLSS